MCLHTFHTYIHTCIWTQTHTHTYTYTHMYTHTLPHTGTSEREQQDRELAIEIAEEDETFHSKCTLVNCYVCGQQ